MSQDEESPPFPDVAATPDQSQETAGNVLVFGPKSGAQDTNNCVIFEWLDTYQCEEDIAGTCTGFRFTNNCEWGVYTSWTDNSKGWPLCREYDDGRSMEPGESGEGVVWYTEDPEIWHCSAPHYTNFDHPDWGTCGDHPQC